MDDLERHPRESSYRRNVEDGKVQLLQERAESGRAAEGGVEDLAEGDLVPLPQRIPGAAGEADGVDGPEDEKRDGAARGGVDGERGRGEERLERDPVLLGPREPGVRHAGG